MNRTVSVATTSILSLVFYFFGFWLWNFPRIAHEIRQPDLWAECNKIVPGQPLQKVIEHAYEKAAPEDVGLSRGTLYFSRRDLACEVRLDSDNKVIEVRAGKVPITVD